MVPEVQPLVHSSPGFEFSFRSLYRVETKIEGDIAACLGEVLIKLSGKKLNNLIAGDFKDSL